MGGTCSSRASSCLGGGVTQVTRLVDADQRVRDYLRAVYDRDYSQAVIEIVADAQSR